MWRATEWLAIAGIGVGTIYYTVNFGWTGFAYCILAALLGGMIVYYMADIMPILGPYLRRMNKRDDDPPQ